MKTKLWKWIGLCIGSCIFVGILILLVSQNTIEKPVDNDYQQAFQNAYRLYSPPIPEKLTFCGENVPLDNYDVREALDRELLVNTYWQSNLILLCKRAYRYFPIIEPILQENNIPDDMKYLAVIESGLMNVVSPAKAAGFWQFMKETGIAYGLEINDEVDQRYDLSLATKAACTYLKKSYQQHSSWAAAAAAYNMGDGGYKRAVSTQKNNNYWDLQLNNETARYVYRILAIKIIFNDLQRYGIHLRLTDLYQPIPTDYVTINTPITNWVDFALQHNISYKQLVNFNPWIRSFKLTNKLGKTYQIAIPKKEYLNYTEQRKNIDKQSLIKDL